MTEIEARVALNAIPKIGPVRVRNLLERFGDAASILRQSSDKLTGCGLPKDAVENLRRWEEIIDLPAELARIRDFGAEILLPEDPLFPPMLREIHDPPLLLHVWGRLTPRDHHAVGVVGCRKPSTYGTECAKKLSYQLAFSGLTVISGMARGIDTLAHTAALAANGRTVAVLGGGLGELYPPENAGLAEKIAANGAVISEFPMGRLPDKQTFPIRNRIVAGWSEGLLVVEAGGTSGAMITANFALEMGRTVFAVPGQINRPMSVGTNNLIKQGARMVTSAEDVLDEYSLLLPPSRPDAAPEGPAPVLGERDAVIFALIMATDEIALDELAEKSGLPSHQVSSSVTTLEMKKLVRALPGHRFAKR